MLKKIIPVLSAFFLIALSGCSLFVKAVPETETTLVTTADTSVTTEMTSSSTSSTPTRDAGLVIHIYKETGMLYAFEGEKELIKAPASYPAGLEAGIYPVKGKERWIETDEGAHAQYCLLLDGGIFLSSPLYHARDINTLIRSTYIGIGRENTSEDLISTQAATARWLFDNCPEGTQVMVFEEDRMNGEKISPKPFDEERMFTDPTDEATDPDDPSLYYIYIEKGSFTITIYAKDENGEYTYPVRSYRTAVGRTPGRTPTGKFEILFKERWHEYKYPYDGGFAQYATTFYGNISIHSPIYSSMDINTMTQEYYLDIGGMKTAGCLRTLTEAAYWIYAYCGIGTTVELVNGSPRDTVSVDIPPIDPEFPNTDPTDPFKREKVTSPVMGISDCAQTGYVNVRLGPGTGYPVIARLADDTMITVLEEDKGWFKVNFLDKEAYVICEAITITDGLLPPFSEKHEVMMPSAAKDELIDELVDVRALDESIIIDLVFAGKDNFTGRVLYPNDICLLQKETANKLIKAQELFKEKGYSIKIVDAYRPFSVQEILYEYIKDPIFVADPKQASHHNRGAAVDIELIGPDGREVEFLTPVHTFSEDASAASQGENEKTKELFEFMVSVMEEAGFYNYEAEWWHFSDTDFQKYMVTDHDLTMAMVCDEQKN